MSWGNRFHFAQFPSKHFPQVLGKQVNPIFPKQSWFSKAFRLFEQCVLLPVLLPHCFLLSPLAGVKLQLLKINFALKYTLGLWCAWWNLSCDHLKVLTAAALHPASAERDDECGSQGEKSRITESLPFLSQLQQIYSIYCQPAVFSVLDGCFDLVPWKKEKVLMEKSNCCS